MLRIKKYLMSLMMERVIILAEFEPTNIFREMYLSLIHILFR